ncbi:MAG: hypothetical protein VW879_06540 [Opitutae bacterium]
MESPKRINPNDAKFIQCKRIVRHDFTSPNPISGFEGFPRIQGWKDGKSVANARSRDRYAEIDGQLYQPQDIVPAGINQTDMKQISQNPPLWSGEFQVLDTPNN